MLEPAGPGSESKTLGEGGRAAWESRDRTALVEPPRHGGVGGMVVNKYGMIKAPGFFSPLSASPEAL